VIVVCSDILRSSSFVLSKFFKAKKKGVFNDLTNVFKPWKLENVIEFIILEAMIMLFILNDVEKSV